MMMCSISTCSGHHYFVDFICGFKWICVFAKWNKSLKPFDMIKEFQNEAGIKLTRKSSLCDLIKVIGIWVILLAYGLVEIGPQITMPGTPQWVDVYERCNRTVLDIVWSELSLIELT